MKFQIFIFLIGYINDNKGVFCLIISYLRIKSYNVLNYNNCSTDWSFPLTYVLMFLNTPIVKLFACSFPVLLNVGAIFYTLPSCNCSRVRIQYSRK